MRAYRCTCIRCARKRKRTVFRTGKKEERTVNEQKEKLLSKKEKEKGTREWR